MSKLRKAMKGMGCMVKLDGICNRDPTTVVGAHLNGSGMGRKDDDLFMAACCSCCHDALDGRTITDYTVEELEYHHLKAVIRTQRLLLNKGLISHA